MLFRGKIGSNRGTMYMNVNSMYPAYLKERENKDILATDFGFIICQPLDKCYYLVDIYVNPENRQSGEAQKLTDMAINKARELGYDKVMGTVVPSAPYATNNLRIMIKYGFEVVSSEANIIYIQKII